MLLYYFYLGILNIRWKSQRGLLDQRLEMKEFLGGMENGNEVGRGVGI
jgi:hypothetical protein